MMSVHVCALDYAHILLPYNIIIDLYHLKLVLDDILCGHKWP